MMEEITFETLVLYLSDELTADEKNRVGLALEKDAQLALKFKEAELVLKGIHRAGEKEVEEKVKSFHLNFKESGEFKKLAETSTSYFRLNATKVIALAASIMILIFVGFTFLKPNSNDLLFADYYSPEKANTLGQLEALNAVGMASQDKQQREFLKQSLIDYSEKRYTASVAALNEYLHKHPQDSIAKLYLGLSLLGAGEYSKARKVLDSLTNESNRNLRDVANWYLALIYIKTGRNAAAKSRLSDILQNPSSQFFTHGSQLLKDLK